MAGLTVSEHDVKRFLVLALPTIFSFRVGAEGDLAAHVEFDRAIDRSNSIELFAELTEPCLGSCDTDHSVHVP
jgi:hypothetical protein